MLAQLLRCDFLPEVWQPDEATRRLRELTGRRSTLVGQRTMMRNRIHSVLAMRLIEPPLKSVQRRRARSGWRPWNSTTRPGCWCDSDLRQLEFLQKEIEALDGELATPRLRQRCGETADDAARRGRDHRRRRCWPPGATSRVFPMAIMRPVTWAWCLRRKQSADHCYHGPITKRGNSHARWMLIEAAQHLDKHPGPLGHFFRRLLRKKNRNVAVVAAARKLAVIGWQMLSQQRALPLRHARDRPRRSWRGCG